MVEQQSPQVLSQRFELMEPIGTGGMGTVYRAVDSWTGRVVAVKRMLASPLQRDDVERFMREAKLLQALQHPGIVAYIAHGVADGGQPFLAMEWLEGEDLSQRLRRSRLSVAETVSLLQATAQALAYAHQAGVVHRDLKPSNLFLRGGKPGRVAILDFGIARRQSSSLPMTRTGSVLGTPDYMAPEQARGDRVVGPAADLFSLGCVLYECLTGQPPFSANHIAATLAKILFADPPPLRPRNADVPEELESLVLAMLAKDPAARPEDLAGRVATLNLPALTAENHATAEPHPGRSHLAQDEQQLLCVLVLTPTAGLLTAATLLPQQAQGHERELFETRRILLAMDASAEELADGSLVVTVHPKQGDATEQVSRAVQCAWRLRKRIPNTNIVLATGRGRSDGRLPIGEVIDRAGCMLEGLQAVPHAAGSQIVLDELSASLLHGRYQLEQQGPGFVLQREGTGDDPSRPLLGKPTPCIGREPELAMLEGILASCIEDSAPRATLITAPPGGGKSRLRHEFLRRTELRGLDVQVWLGVCDPLGNGTPYGPLARILRQLARLHEAATIDEKRGRLRQRIAEHVPAANAPFVSELLGEICGLHFGDEHNVKLRAARQDPRLMADLVLQALLMWMRAESGGRPLLLVLEDLQWCDSLTIKAVATALNQLSDRPLYVLALARPEIQSIYPQLWRGAVQPLQLRPIGRKASERLVQQFLGGVVSPTAQLRIVEQADGNPLWLEELIRLHAEGASGEVPPTILAMLQARIGQMKAADRQFLRAASVFGEVFWLGGVQTLVQQASETELHNQADALVDREILINAGSSRYPGQRELRFRHSLMRDAAHSLLTEEDRVLGHRLACVFLETQGESEAAVLAEHAARGADRERAMQYYSRAAEEALASNDLPAACRHAQAGLSCEPTSAARGKLRAIEANALQWAGELHAARDAGLDALSLLPRGSRRWFQALHALWMTTTYLGEAALFRSLQETFRGAVPDADAISAYVECASFLVVMTSLIGQAGESRELLDELERETAPYIEDDIAVRGWVRFAQGVYCHWIESNLWRKAELAEVSAMAADCIGDRRMRCLALTSLGLAQMGLGSYADGEATFRQALRLVQTMQGEKYLLGSTSAFFAAGLLDRGDPAQLDEAMALSQECLAAVYPKSASAGVAHVNLARGYLRQGRVAEAEHHAGQGEATLRVEPAVLPIAVAALAESQAQRGDLDTALHTVRAGLQGLQQVGTCSTELDLLVCAAEILARQGAAEEARATWTTCVLRLARNALSIPDLDVRKRYLREVPLNARLLAGAGAFLGADAVERLLSG